MQRPTSTEYKPFAATYINLVPDKNFLDTLNQSTKDTIAFFNSIPAAKQEYRYAEGKWTIKEVLMHITDTERVMSYRALTGIRGDSKSIMCDMDQDLYVAGADVTDRTISDILEEFAAIRLSTIKLFQHVNVEQSLREVRMNDGTIFTVRALGYIIIGHALHHTNITKERYL